MFGFFCFVLLFNFYLFINSSSRSSHELIINQFSLKLKLICRSQRKKGETEIFSIEFCELTRRITNSLKKKTKKKQSAVEISKRLKRVDEVRRWWMLRSRTNFNSLDDEFRGLFDQSPLFSYLRYVTSFRSNTLWAVYWPLVRRAPEAFPHECWDPAVLPDLHVRQTFPRSVCIIQ